MTKEKSQLWQNTHCTIPFYAEENSKEVAFCLEIQILWLKYAEKKGNDEHTVWVTEK